MLRRREKETLTMSREIIKWHKNFTLDERRKKTSLFLANDTI